MEINDIQPVGSNVRCAGLFCSNVNDEVSNVSVARFRKALEQTSSSMDVFSGSVSEFKTRDESFEMIVAQAGLSSANGKEIKKESAIPATQGFPVAPEAVESSSRNDTIAANIAAPAGQSMPTASATPAMPQTRRAPAMSASQTPQGVVAASPNTVVPVTDASVFATQNAPFKPAGPTVPATPATAASSSKQAVFETAMPNVAMAANIPAEVVVSTVQAPQTMPAEQVPQNPIAASLDQATQSTHAAPMPQSASVLQNTFAVSAAPLSGEGAQPTSAVSTQQAVDQTAPAISVENSTPALQEIAATPLQNAAIPRATAAPSIHATQDTSSSRLAPTSQIALDVSDVPAGQISLSSEAEAHVSTPSSAMPVIDATALGSAAATAMPKPQIAQNGPVAQTVQTAFAADTAQLSQIGTGATMTQAPGVATAIPVAQEAQATSAAPVAQNAQEAQATSAAPVAQNAQEAQATSAAPVAQNAQVAPTISAAPIAQNIPVTQTAPIAQPISAEPVAQAESVTQAIPATQTASAVPAVSTAPTVSAAQAAPVSQNVSAEQVAQADSVTQTIPAAQTVSSSPATSTVPAPQAVSTAPVEQDISAGQAVPKEQTAFAASIAPAIEQDASVPQNAPVARASAPVASMPNVSAVQNTPATPVTEAADVQEADSAAAPKVGAPQAADTSKAPLSARRVSEKSKNQAAKEAEASQYVQPQTVPLANAVGAAPQVERVSAAGVSQAAETARTREIVQTVEAICDTILVSPGIMKGEGEIQIQLKPQVLDGTEIKLAVHGRELSIDFSPASTDAQQILERNLPMLEQHLASRIHNYQIAVALKKGKNNERV